MFRLLVVSHRAFATSYQVAVPGYIDKEDRRVQYFVKDFRLFGVLRVYTKVLFKEIVPSWAWIQQSTTGYTDWRSAAPQALWDLCVYNKSP